MSKAILSLMLVLSGLIQQLPTAFPRDGARQLIDNDRVTVWDVTWPKGKPTVLHQNKYDVVSVELANAAVRITGKNGKAKATTLKSGQATFELKDITQLEEGTSDPPRHSIVIELKDKIVAPLEYHSAFPDAFPRDGSKKLLDNKRITIWDYTWTQGVPTPMHFHSKDVVVVYMETGEVRSTALDASIVINKVEPGLAKFNARNRTHTEELIKGASRAIIVELK